MTSELYDGVTRRSVLKTGAATAGAVTIGAAAAGADEHGGSNEKRGGRAQVEGNPDRNRPFTLSDTPEEATMSASCMSGESAQQVYLEYGIEYCDSDNDESDDTMYVIPNEAHLSQDETYMFRAIQDCKATDNTLVAFGPSNSGEC